MACDAVVATHLAVPPPPASGRAIQAAREVQDEARADMERRWGVVYLNILQVWVGWVKYVGEVGAGSFVTYFALRVLLCWRFFFFLFFQMLALSITLYVKHFSELSASVRCGVMALSLFPSLCLHLIRTKDAGRWKEAMARAFAQAEKLPDKEEREGVLAELAIDDRVMPPQKVFFPELNLPSPTMPLPTEVR